MTSFSTVISMQGSGPEMQMTVLGLELSSSLSLGCGHGVLFSTLSLFKKSTQINAIFNKAT